MRTREAALSARLGPAVETRLGIARGTIERSNAALAALGPQATLDRGYAIVRRAIDGSVVRDPSEAPVGDLLAIRVAAGEMSARVAGKDGSAPGHGGSPARNPRRKDPA